MAATLKPISGKIQCDGSVLCGPDDITPEWHKIPIWCKWVAIDSDGEEFAFENKPLWIKCIWCGGDNVYTGRKFDMSVIDWKETLSERPK